MTDTQLIVAAKQTLARREMARRHFLPFVTEFVPNYVVGWVHKVFAAELERFYHDVQAGKCPKLMVFVPPRHGKELAHDTPVLTPEGWTTHGELRPGDFVYHPSGKPVKVLALSPEENMDDYEVEFSNGEKITAHANHEWVVYDRSKHGSPVRTLETKALAESYWLSSKGVRGGRARWQLPDVEGIEFTEKNLPLNPYVLGVWLGDGTKGTSCITTSEDGAAVFRQAFVEAGYSCSAVYTHKDYHTHRGYFGDGKLIADLRSSGVLLDKHIPEVYLRASTAQRLQLLAGLIDTDGHVETTTGRCHLVTTSEALRDGVMDLCTTLGFRPNVSSVNPATPTSEIEGREKVYIVGFQPHVSLPTKLDRKRIEKFAQRRKVSIKNVRRVLPKPGRCIEVDSADGLYLAGKKLIPTHNSQQVSGTFPAWALGKDPSLNIIMSSYAVTLPEKFSRENRTILRDPKYKAIFPQTEMSKDSTSVNEWYTTRNGGIKCAGVGGGIGGFGADIFIIDDPIKDYEEAQSETIREIANNWYTSVAEARLSPKGGMIIVQTRWHDADLAGHRLSVAAQLRREGFDEDEIEDWRVVSFPALALQDEYLDENYQLHYEPGEGRVHIRAPGEALHPKRYPEKVLRRKRAGMPTQQWSALYQQQPVPDSGEFFTKDDFVYYTQAPQLHQYPVIFAWDLALGKNDINDYTVGLAAAVIPYNNINHVVLLDYFRGRVRGKETIEAMVNMYEKYKDNAYSLGIEYGQVYLSIIDELEEEFERRNIQPHIDDSLKPVKEKRVRANPARGWMQNHRVMFPDPRIAPWADTMKAEMLRFDAGVHDDIVDALAWLIIMARKMPTVEKYQPRSAYGKPMQARLNDYARNQHRSLGTGYMAS